MDKEKLRISHSRIKEYLEYIAFQHINEADADVIDYRLFPESYTGDAIDYLEQSMDGHIYEILSNSLVHVSSEPLRAAVVWNRQINAAVMLFGTESTLRQLEQSYEENRGFAVVQSEAFPETINLILQTQEAQYVYDLFKQQYNPNQYDINFPNRTENAPPFTIILVGQAIQRPDWPMNVSV